jgi:selenide,water dikinase
MADSLVGRGDADDAAVMRLDDERALVTTVDACPPMVDDPEAYGAIVAANAIGDVLAMGGRVVSALAVLAIPRDSDPEMGAAILRGARTVVEECGGAIVGGHTVHAPGILFGLSVTGLVHPERLWRTSGARAGDVLVLSRPIGVGLAVSHATGVHRDAVIAQIRRPAHTEAANLALLGSAVHAATDVTGFGLLGHALDLAADDVRVEIDVERVPMLPVAVGLAAAGHRTSAHGANREWVAGQVDADLSDQQWAMLVDPQTTGGLLAAIEPGVVPDGFTVIGRCVARRSDQAALVVRSGAAMAKTHEMKAGAA